MVVQFYGCGCCTGSQATQPLVDRGIVKPPSAQKPPPGPVSQRAKRQVFAVQVSSSPKCARTEAQGTPEASASPWVPASESEAQLDKRPEEEQRPITTVASRDRDARVHQDHKAALIRRRLEFGLVTADAEAADEEFGAYVAVPVRN